jgi:hypothetical protein
MSALDNRPKCFQGKYGVYLSYYLAEKAFIRLMGNLMEEDDSWVSFDANPDTWHPLVALHIAVWEANTDWYHKSNFVERDDAWTIAQIEARKRERPTIHNEWFADGQWHVNSIHPRGKA